MPATDVSTAYSEDRLAALYDELNPWGPADEFYLRHVLDAASVLDVGCGTGELLVRARQAGHSGELVGLDPAAGMLAVARAKSDDIVWLQGDAGSTDLGRTFELITMTGHAFQELLDDTAVRAALAAFHRHLTPGGRLAFETRNPTARAWERWTPADIRAVRSPAGEAFDVWYDFRASREPDLVDYAGTFRSHATRDAFTSASTLRFVEPGHLRSRIAEAGFRVDGWYGDWAGSAVTPSSPEIIVVAVRG